MKHGKKRREVIIEGKSTHIKYASNRKVMQVTFTFSKVDVKWLGNALERMVSILDTMMGYI